MKIAYGLYPAFAGLYATAGLLDGMKTTSHWGFRDNLRAMGARS